MKKKLKSSCKFTEYENNFQYQFSLFQMIINMVKTKKNRYKNHYREDKKTV